MSPDPPPGDATRCARGPTPVAFRQPAPGPLARAELRLRDRRPRPDRRPLRRPAAPGSSTPATAIPTRSSSPPRWPRSRARRRPWSVPPGWPPSRRPCSPWSARATTWSSPRDSTARRPPSSPGNWSGSASPTTASIRPIPSRLRSLITAHTRLVLVETLSNPLLRVADLEAIARVGREADVPVLVDHTFAPLLCRPLALGATLVMHSVTKLIGGHSDLTLGVVAGPRDRIDRIRAVASTFGQTGNPFESWLALRGLATLSLRSDRASATALELAHAPRGPSAGRPGLLPGPLLASRFRAGPPPAQGRLRRHGDLRRRRPGPGRSPDPLAPPHPLRPQPGRRPDDPQPPVLHQPSRPGPRVLERLGITPGLIRLSVGLEDVEDLWADLARALG